jgi:bifunctional UDP-N-acetylglucosamine pyrophosphorylase / glucosamine-1-phosphate N-acetyltransferase
MELQPRGYKKVVQLMDKGANIPNPSSLHIGDEVDLSRVSAKGLTIYPGCRIYGAKTVISPGATLGLEGPVTLEDCALGPKVELRGGYYKQSVFLEKASMGLAAEVREGCLIEEEASGAHAVGLKQTILFPFVTLGSLVNFCDCFMAGGTSRADHSEVGSSYIHFNFTPDGDKATASMFGDVPRGVMLNQPPIFLGGQGGAVGPLRVDFGTVVAAGSILRNDVNELRQLVFSPPPRAMKRGHSPFAFKNFAKVLKSNVAYLANLTALEEWYRVVRHVFFARQEMGELVYAAALEAIALAMWERARRLQAMVDKAVEVGAADGSLSERVNEVCALFGSDRPSQLGPEGEAFLTGLLVTASEHGGGYVEAIQALSPGLAEQGAKWLQATVDGLCSRADAVLRTDRAGGPVADASA